MRAIAELFATDHPPLYAHLTLARAALESAVASAWLNEPGITTTDRIKRGICELLYSQLSAVDHVTWFGLFSAFDVGAAHRDERAGTATVPVGVNGAKVSAYLYYVIKVLHAAATARFTLMG